MVHCARLMKVPPRVVSVSAEWIVSERKRWRFFGGYQAWNHRRPKHLTSKFRWVTQFKEYTISLCTTLGDPKFDLFGVLEQLEKKLELFDAALQKQTLITTENITGHGIDIHLLGLREMAKDYKMYAEIIEDETYALANQFLLSTSQVWKVMRPLLCESWPKTIFNITILFPTNSSNYRVHHRDFILVMRSSRNGNGQIIRT